MAQIIVQGMLKLKGGGTFEEIATASGLRPEQTWKRFSEMERDGLIFNTGATRPLSSGVNGIVWQLYENISQPVQSSLFNHL